MNVIDIASSLKKYLNQSHKILFYPSSGVPKENIFSLNYDVFIFSDKYPNLSHDLNMKDNRSYKFLRNMEKINIFKISDKIGYFCSVDNNNVLQAIEKSLLKISCLVGVNDGCCEGGNDPDKCVNGNNWLCQAFNLFPDKGGMYITDHYIGDSPEYDAVPQDFSMEEFQTLTIGRWVANQTHNCGFNKTVNEIFKPQFSDLTVVYEIRRRS